MNARYWFAFLIPVLVTEAPRGRLPGPIEELEAEHKGHSHVTVLTEAVAKDSSIINRTLVYVYNFFLAHCQSWMKYYYNFIEWLKPDRSAIGYWLTSRYIKELFLQARPCVIVSVHPMINHHLAGRR